MKLVSALAKILKSGGMTRPSWVPRPPTQQLQLGTITAVDPFNGVVTFQTADPSATSVTGVRYMQAYSASNPPAAGHAVWAQQYGTDLVVLGQHIVQTNVVTPT